MLDLLDRIILVAFLLGVWVYVTLFLSLRKSAINLTISVLDPFTEVLDVHGNSLVKVPNKIFYTWRKGKLHLIAIGQNLNDITAMGQGRESDVKELNLVFDQEATTQRFEGVWRSFIVHCCERARQALGKRWSPLSVKVIARTSNAHINQKLQEEIEHRSLRFFGEFKVVDS